MHRGRPPGLHDPPRRQPAANPCPRHWDLMNYTKLLANPPTSR
jgi:hypothetical protein